MSRLLKLALCTTPVPAAFVLGFAVSRYLIDRELREGESLLRLSIANYEAARAEHVTRLQDHYARIELLISRLEERRTVVNGKH